MVATKDTLRIEVDAEKAIAQLATIGCVSSDLESAIASTVEVIKAGDLPNVIFDVLKEHLQALLREQLRQVGERVSHHG